MKKLLATTSFLVLGSASVLAADLPVKYKPAPYIAAPVFSWTGCYLGVHGGGAAMRDSFSETNGTGGIAGGQVGCNYQDGNWVFGVEGEGYWSGIKARSSFTSLNNEGFSQSWETRNKYDFSIAARAGIAFDRTLIYGKAGWVWGKFDLLYTQTGNICCDVPMVAAVLLDPRSVFTSSGSATLDGLLLGFGIEHAFTQNITAKAEYNYLRFGAKEFAFTGCEGSYCFPIGSESHHADKHMFKLGVNYLFNMGKAPLVAKY
jgi:outer membrane immunogenic protein